MRSRNSPSTTTTTMDQKYFPHSTVTCRGYFMHDSSSRSKIEASSSPTNTTPRTNDIQQQPTRPVEISVMAGT